MYVDLSIVEEVIKKLISIDYKWRCFSKQDAMILWRSEFFSRSGKRMKLEKVSGENKGKNNER